MATLETLEFKTLRTYTIEVQAYAARSAEIAAHYRDLGPSWALQAKTMQAVAAQHYEMARSAMDYYMQRRALKRAAQAVTLAGGNND